ncbi:unnamed protein product [Sphenostylis stenocarpa]|uniref:BURP domain-containing protein n=1 Tax=Sphenostylis stenocarpa TaxID=92480 RepID=A0AA86S566_9FABA|nr:unnamed protein product [Sphenostylis stenocarpa]
MKVELQDQKQVDEGKATLVSSNTPYLGGYKTTSKSVEPNYIASYTATKHHHHHEKLNQPYKASYTTSDAHKANQPDYFYKTNTYDFNHPYVTAYGAKKTPKKSHNSDATVPYITSYGGNTPAQEANLPYITAYGAKTVPKDSPSDDATVPYITSYTRTTPAQGANHPYITAYGAKKVPKESPNDDTTVPYITSYARTTPAKEANHPYITSYGAKKVPKDSTSDDTTVPYITSYGGTTHGHEANHPYVTAYGSKKVSKGSTSDDTTAPYIAQYGGTGPKNDPKKSSNVDRTEAFKVGFFALDDLHVGNVMTLQFPIQEVSHFLPKKEADSIPFSTSQLPSVLQLFSISEDSPEANAMRETLLECEGEPITGETKICATSLESMLEFVGTTIGSETKRNLLTTSLPTASGVPLQKFTILEVSEDINAPKWVACHPLPYPYALYYCHFIATGSKVFKVSLGSENGDNKVEALGICHLDTSDWNPDHIIFRQLGIKAGQDPVCHFFPVKHLLWVPQPSEATM